jgi:hypothetical protein
VLLVERILILFFPSLSQPGWPEKWETGVGWSLSDNHCLDCADGCDVAHHQSPIALERKWAYYNQTDSVNCEDWHWMKYYDGTCTWDHLVKADAFSIERHSLRVAQPLEEYEDGQYRLNCLVQGRGRLFGRIDFSKGFHRWWFLNHMELKVPSEHVQNGRRYDAEVQLAHFYSVDAETNGGVANEMGTVSIFLQAHDNVEPYPYLDKLICQWRLVEEREREKCGLPSVSTQYPGCFNYKRGASMTSTARDSNNDALTRDRNLRASMASTARDSNNDELRRGRSLPRSVLDKDASGAFHLDVDQQNFRGDDMTEDEWSAFQENYSRNHPLNSTNPFSNGQRHLMNYDHVSHNGYQFLLDARTEYYYRYQGTMTIPPCYGLHVGGSRIQTNHWRVMKDPIRVRPHQIDELNRLLKDRTSPFGADSNACQRDTAGKVDSDGKISVARPLQQRSRPHYNTFCQCDRWSSKVPEDRAWCKSGDRDYRLEGHPYNWESGGF